MDDPLGVAALNDWVGKELPPYPQPMLGMSQVDSPDPVDVSDIRRSAYSVADYNPLYDDPAYAKTTRHGGVVAPPYFFYAIESGGGHPPVPPPENTTVVYAGTDWEYFTPLRVGDVVHTKRKFLRAEEKQSKFSGRAAYFYGETTYLNQRDEILATAVAIHARFHIEDAKSQGKYKGEDAMPTFDEAMLRKIQHDKQHQEIRGAEPRYFDDVEVGDVLTPIVQGPLWMGECVFYFQGARRWKTGESTMAYPRDPAEIPLHPMPDPWTAGHTNNEPGQAFENRAMPRGFDVGYQRVAWLQRLASSWVGDDGDIKSLKGRLTRPNFEGDVSWYTGKVVGKRVERGEHLVDCELTAHNQDDLAHTFGSFTAALPTKSGK